MSINAKRIQTAKALLDEIAIEIEYADKRAEAEKEAKAKATVRYGKEKGSWNFWEFMPEKFIRDPARGHIKRCAMLIRQILLELYRDKD